MYNKTVLDSGITVVTEAHRYQRSVAVGAFILTGTRDEMASQMGISHFIEHLVFKGTKRRSAYEIARSIEAVGGDLNAFTTREYICFHALSLMEDLKLSIDVLGDLVTQADFSQRDFDREKNVILQEISMTEDTPEEYIYDLFFEKVYHGSPLGWPILGVEKTLSKMSRMDLRRHYKSQFLGSNIIVAAAGALDHHHVVEMVERAFKLPKKRFRRKKRQHAKFKPVREVIDKEGEQSHLLVGFSGVSFMDPRRFDAFVLNAWLGGGMSSKLYQSIREKRGLAYSVYSNLTTFTDAGALTIYVATDDKSIPVVFDAIKKDMLALKRKRISSENLEMFRQQVRGSILLGADDMENRMSSLGVNEMTFGEYMPVESIVQSIESVTPNGVRELAQKVLDLDKMAILIMGQTDKKKINHLIGE